MSLLLNANVIATEETRILLELDNSVLDLIYGGGPPVIKCPSGDYGLSVSNGPDGKLVTVIDCV